MSGRGSTATGARRLLLAILGAAAVVVAVAGPTAAAVAAGDQDLDPFIVTNPLPGWTPSPDEQVQAVVDSEQRVETAAAAALNGSARVAARAWQGPNASSTLFVSLIRVNLNGSQADQSANATALAVPSAADTFCAGAQADPPTDRTTVDAIPGSKQVVCSTAPNGSQPGAVTFARANILVIVAGNGVDGLKLDAVALAQFAALPAGVTGGPSGSSATTPAGAGSTSGSSPTAASSTHSTAFVAGEVIGVALVVALVIVLVLLVARRRPKGATPAFGGAVAGGAPGAGWFADPGGSGNLRYWDGASWSPHVSGPMGPAGPAGPGGPTMPTMPTAPPSGPDGPSWPGAAPPPPTGPTPWGRPPFG